MSPSDQHVYAHEVAALLNVDESQVIITSITSIASGVRIVSKLNFYESGDFPDDQFITDALSEFGSLTANLRLYSLGYGASTIAAYSSARALNPIVFQTTGPIRKI